MCNHKEWRALQRALDASRSLMSFCIHAFREIHLLPPFMEHLALNKTLVNLNIVISPLDNEYFGESRGQVVYLLCAILHLVSV